MREDWDKKLCEDFPGLYAQRNLPMIETCMCWGFDTGDGLYDIIYDLSKKITELDPDVQAVLLAPAANGQPPQLPLPDHTATFAPPEAAPWFNGRAPLPHTCAPSKCGTLRPSSLPSWTYGDLLHHARQPKAPNPHHGY